MKECLLSELILGLSSARKESDGTTFLNQVNPHYKTTSKPSYSEAYREKNRQKFHLKLILSLFLQLPTLTFIHGDFAEAALPLSVSHTGRTTSKRAG